MFYSEKHPKLPTTKIVGFYNDEMKMETLLQGMNYK